MAEGGAAHKSAEIVKEQPTGGASNKVVECENLSEASFNDDEFSVFSEDLEEYVHAEGCFACFRR